MSDDVPGVVEVPEVEGGTDGLADSDQLEPLEDAPLYASLDDVRSAVAEVASIESARVLSDYDAGLDARLTALESGLSADIDKLGKSLKTTSSGAKSDSTASLVVLDSDQWDWMQYSIRTQTTGLVVLGVALFALIGLELWGNFTRGWRRG